MEEDLISRLTEWFPFAYAFGAGMVATVNPCGFLMLPSYVAYYLGMEDGGTSPSLLRRGRQGLALSLAITSGFIVLFLAIGLGISFGGRALVSIFPMTGLVVGVALVLLGVWLLVGRRWLGIAAASRVVVDFRRSLKGAFFFGLGYGLASLSCTLPVFLVVVGSALSAQGLDEALLQFLAYSLGMGFILAAVVISAAFFKGVLQRVIRQVLPYVHLISALFLIGAGAYLIYRGVRFGGLF